MQVQSINFTGKFQNKIDNLSKKQKIGIATAATTVAVAGATVAGLAVKGKKINKNAKLGESIKLGWNALKKATSKKFNAAKETVQGWFKKDKKSKAKAEAPKADAPQEAPKGKPGKNPKADTPNKK